jgi:hypothetical protein
MPWSSPRSARPSFSLDPPARPAGWLSGTRRLPRARARERPRRLRSPGQEHAGRVAPARHGRPSPQRPRLRLRALRLRANVPGGCMRRGQRPARPGPIVRSIRAARACLAYSAVCRLRAHRPLPRAGLVASRGCGKRREGMDPIAQRRSRRRVGREGRTPLPATRRARPNSAVGWIGAWSHADNDGFRMPSRPRRPV